MSCCSTVFFGTSGTAGELPIGSTAWRASKAASQLRGILPIERLQRSLRRCCICVKPTAWGPNTHPRYHAITISDAGVYRILRRNEGRIVSRAMLLQHVWDLHFDPTTNIIDVYVGRVRRKVDGQQAYPLIHTVRGIGYCLRAPG
jgi:DNA-binding response OmpR family regulator